MKEEEESWMKTQQAERSLLQRALFGLSIGEFA